MANAFDWAPVGGVTSACEGKKKRKGSRKKGVCGYGVLAPGMADLRRQFMRVCRCGGEEGEGQVLCGAPVPCRRGGAKRASIIFGSEKQGSPQYAYYQGIASGESQGYGVVLDTAPEGGQEGGEAGAQAYYLRCEVLQKV